MKRWVGILATKGVSAQVADGQVMIERSSLGLPAKGDFRQISLAQAIREGHIEIA